MSLQALSSSDRLLNSRRRKNLSKETENENESVSHSVVSDSLQPDWLLPARLLFPWNSLSRNTGWVHSFLKDHPDPGIKQESPALKGRFFMVWATRNTSGKAQAPCKWLGSDRELARPGHLQALVSIQAVGGPSPGAHIIHSGSSLYRVSALPEPNEAGGMPTYRCNHIWAIINKAGVHICI